MRAPFAGAVHRAARRDIPRGWAIVLAMLGSWALVEVARRILIAVGGL